MDDALDELVGHLERSGRPGRTTPAKLLGRLGLDAASDADRQEATRRLAEHGVSVEPPLAGAAPEDRITLTRADAASAERLARAARAAAPRQGSWWDEPAAATAQTEASGAPRGAAGPDAAPVSSALPQGVEAIRALLLLGAVAVLGGLLLPWYSGERSGVEVEDLSSGWEWLSVLDVVLAVVGVAAFALLARPRDVLLARALTVVGAAAVFVVAMRIGSPPSGPLEGVSLDVSPSYGPFVTLAGALAVVTGAARAAGWSGPRPGPAAGRT